MLGVFWNYNTSPVWSAEQIPRQQEEEDLNRNNFRTQAGCKAGQSLSAQSTVTSSRPLQPVLMDAPLCLASVRIRCSTQPQELIVSRGLQGQAVRMWGCRDVGCRDVGCRDAERVLWEDTQ